MAELGTCSDCGGPAKWTIHNDEVWEHCPSCWSLGIQLDMFSEVVPGYLPGGDDVVRLDKPVSVSGLDEDEASVESSDRALPNLGRALPF